MKVALITGALTAGAGVGMYIMRQKFKATYEQGGIEAVEKKVACNACDNIVVGTMLAGAIIFSLSLFKKRG